MRNVAAVALQVMQRCAVFGGSTCVCFEKCPIDVGRHIATESPLFTWAEMQNECEKLKVETWS